MVAVTTETSADYARLPASNARAIFHVFAFSLVFADERLKQAKREEVRMKEEKSRSGRVVE